MKKIHAGLLLALGAVSSCLAQGKYVGPGAGSNSGGGGTGTTGATGATPSISVDATTLAAGSAATVSRTGTDVAPVIHFGIPRGADGASGSGGNGNSSTGPKNGFFESTQGTGGDTAPDVPSAGSVRFSSKAGKPCFLLPNTTAGSCLTLFSPVAGSNMTITPNADGTATFASTASGGGGGGSQHSLLRFFNDPQYSLNVGAGAFDKAIVDFPLTEDASNANASMVLDRAITITGVRYKAAYTPCTTTGPIQFSVSDRFTGSVVVLAGTATTGDTANGYGYDQTLPTHAITGLNIPVAAGHKIFVEVSGTVPSGQNCSSFITAQIEYIGS